MFVVSSSEGFIEATSYVSVGEVDIYAEGEDSITWDALSDDIKQNLLNRASLAVDGVQSYQNLQTDDDQLLKFPRNDKKTIPQAVKYATCSVALAIARDDAFKNIKEEIIGKVELEYFQNYNAASAEVLAYLRPFRMTSLRFKIV